MIVANYDPHVIKVHMFINNQVTSAADLHTSAEP